MLYFKRSTIFATTWMLALPIFAAFGPLPRHLEYSAILRGNGTNNVLGFASMEPNDSSSVTEVTVQLKGETAGAVRQWSVRSGTCSKPGRIWGDSLVYKPLLADAGGVARIRVTAIIQFPDTGAYYIEMYGPQKDSSKPYLCSDFYMED